MLTSTKIFAKYFNFLDIFTLDFVVELPVYIRINDHFIDLLEDKQPLYSLIYSLGPMELKILKIYIKANQASGFIRLFKTPTGILILFVWKKNDSLHLDINYQELNNMTIKNCYLLPLINELLNYIGRAKHFTQLDLINTYYQMRIRKGDE